MEYRIGQSRDIHRLEDNNRQLIVAGVIIPCGKGVVSHSDGDVVYHALSEAILGALALGDLGTFYPDNDEKYHDCPSSYFVKDTVRMMIDKGYIINNVDINVVLEKPKLKKYILEMRKNIAELLNTSIENVSLKAQTNEGCSEIGLGNAIEATAICLLRKK